MIKKTLYGLIILNSVSLFANNNILSEHNPDLSTREWHSISLAKEWMNNGNKSFRGEDGSITFLYGATMPRIISAPLRITDIQLQAGEQIKDVQIGDSTRWMITPSISGSKPHEVSHLIIKPTDVGLETTLVILTNRRTYHLNLLSRRTEYMPIVSFRYKSEINKKWSAYQEYFQTQAKEEKKAKVVQVTSTLIRNIEDLDFNYKLIGETSWKPVRVYNDGIKTYIEMHESISFQEAPILMVLDSHDNTQLVNYRLKENKYIVDKLFNKAILVIGVGDNQEVITIQRNNTKQQNSTSQIWEEPDEDI